jgi:hypothetical protein
MNFVIPTSRKFLTQYRNGDTFATNPTTDFVSYYQGNTLEKMRLDATYQVYTITEASELSPIQVYQSGAEYVLKLSATEWSSEGFVVGNSLRLESGASSTNSATVSNIVGNLMYITSINILTLFGFTDGDFQTNLTIKNRTVPTGLIFKFGIIPNSLIGSSFQSLLDGQTQVYSSNAITSSYSSLNYLATESSNLGGVQCKYDGSSGTGNFIFTFSVQHTFRTPHYIQDWLSAYSGDTVPTSFAGTNSYRYLSQLQFSNNILDPNDRKQFTDGFQLGSVGFRDQNFNAGTSNYDLISVSYDTGEAPEVTAVTTVTARIKRLSGAFTSGVKGYLYHSKLPTVVEYSSNTNTYDYNYILDSISNTAGAVAVDSDLINNFSFQINGSNSSLIDITFELSYDAAQKLRLPNGTWIFLGFAIETQSLSAPFSDRVLIGLDTVQVTKDSDIEGLANNFQANFNEPSSAFSKSNAKVWNNRLLECDFSFDLTKVNTGDYNFLTNLKYQLVGYDGSDYFELDSYNFPLGLILYAPVGGSVYQIKNLDTERFLAVPSGSSLREVKLTMAAPATFEATQEVSGKLGFTIPWQQWKENIDVPMVFYNGALPTEFYNRNDRTSNYSAEEGYEIYVFLTASLSYNGANTNYIFYSDPFYVYEFEEDGAGTSWALDSFKIFNSVGDELADLDGTTENRIEFVLSNPTMTGISEQSVIAELVTEPINNLGREYRLHSDLIWSEVGNPLTPESGETGVKIAVDLILKTVTISCLVDGTMLDSITNHNFYVHLYE